MQQNQELTGIDVSHHQGEIHWPTVKSYPVTFALAKATEGATCRDPNFNRNFQAIRQAEMTPGAYHFFRGSSTPPEQAENILTALQAVQFAPATDLFALDLEQNDQLNPTEVANRVHELIVHLADFLLPQQILIYTSPSWWDSHVDGTVYDFTQHPLWVAHWTTAASPRLPGSWKSWRLWQYSSTGEIPGIRGKVDLNRMQCSG